MELPFWFKAIFAQKFMNFYPRVVKKTIFITNRNTSVKVTLRDVRFNESPKWTVCHSFIFVLLGGTVNLLNKLYLKAALVIQIFTSLSNFTYFELDNWLFSWLRVPGDASSKPLPGELGSIVVFILDAHNNQK